MNKLNYTVIILSLLVLTFTSINAAEARHTRETSIGKILMPETKSEKIDELPVNQQKEVYYLEDLIRYDKKGIKMSQKLLDKAEHPELKQFVQDTINVKTKEIEQIESWQKQWFEKIYN